MELAELQETWSKLDKKVESQKTITDKMIMDVVKIKHNNKISGFGRKKKEKRKVRGGKKEKKIEEGKK